MGQGAEASGSRINASIGVALNDQESPCLLQSLRSKINVPDEAMLYSGSYGQKELRKAWNEELLRKNPGLKGHSFSLPLLTSGLTHGLNLAGNLFLEPGKELILSSPVYDNYQHSFGGFFQAKLKSFPLLKDHHFNAEGLRRLINAGGEELRILLNFPNNPLGFSLNIQEAQELKNLLKEACEEGKKILLILDDAYFGLFYEDNLLKESLFSYLADLHKNLLLMKIDGSSKEYFAWGLRIGFVSFQGKNLDSADYTALENRTAAIVRSTVSNVSLMCQTILLEAMKSPDILNEKQELEEGIKERYRSIKGWLSKNDQYKSEFLAEPFNSGYFFCLRLRKGISAENMRKKLRKRDIGVFAPTDEHLRIAFSSLKEKDIPELFEEIYNCSREL